MKISTILMAAFAVLLWIFVFHLQQKAYKEFHSPKMWDASQGRRQ